MKIAVHCDPSVKSWTPGWMVAVAAGAHAAVRAACDGGAAASGAMTVVAETAEMMRERVRMAWKRSTRRKLVPRPEKSFRRNFQRRARTTAVGAAARITTPSAG